MSARLKSGLWVRAILRRVAGEGRSAMVLHRGDEDAGDVVVVAIERSSTIVVLRETMSEPGWSRVPIDDQAALDTYLARQRRYDPDLWIIEVEVSSIDGPLEEFLGRRRDFF